MRLLVSEERHVTIERAARMLGFGTDRLVRVEVDGEGPHATRPRCAPRSPPATGRRSSARRPATSTPARSIRWPRSCDLAAEHGAWVHVDGAFGLWAGAAGLAPPPRRRRRPCRLVGHRRPQVAQRPLRRRAWPSSRDPEAHHAAFSASAAYLPHAGRATRWTGRRTSRAAPRSFAVYAALRSLGRDGVAELVERCCACARRFAEVLGAEEGVEVLNDVVLNQVLVRFGDDDATTDAVVAAVQAEGTCWMSPTTWRGRQRDAHLGLQLGDDVQRRGSLVRSDPRRATDGGGPGGTAAVLTDEVGFSASWR